MRQRQGLGVLYLFAASALLLGAQSGGDTAHARAIHARVLTIDTHDDIPFDFATPSVDPGVRGDRQVDIPKMREGGLDAGFFVVYVGQGKRDEAGNRFAHDQAMLKFNAIHRMAEEMHPDKIGLATTSADVERIAKSGKLVACIGIENGWVIGRDLALLKKYHALGARYITLAHNGHNDICDSANPSSTLGDAPAEWNGVSPFGEKVIAEMNRLGIMVDVSHVSKKSMLDAIRLSKAPVIGSHSSTRALADTPRNMDDEQLLALKAGGGVVQVCALSSFVKVDSEERKAAVAALRKEFGIIGFGERPDGVADPDYERRMASFRSKLKELDGKPAPLGKANVQDFVNHIDYAVKLIGIDHVGISSDFDGGGGINDWNDASETVNVTIELVKRGYTEEQIAKLWGQNLLRVWREVEKVAARPSQDGKTN